MTEKQVYDISTSGTETTAQFNKYGNIELVDSLNDFLLLNKEVENLYGVLKDHFEGNDDMEDDDDYNENQSLPYNRDRYDWFDPTDDNVTCLTDGDIYDLNKYLIQKEKTCTLVEQIGHHYKHVQLHEKEVENLRDVWDNDNQDDEDICVCGNGGCDHRIAHELFDVEDTDVVKQSMKETRNSVKDGCGNGSNGPTVIKDIQRSVNLNTTVNVTDATIDQRNMYEEMSTLVEGNFETFVKKNLDYGSSFTDTEVGWSDEGPFNSQFESVANGLLVRMSDKQQRLENLVFGGQDHVDESMMDTALDLANYALMLAYTIDKNNMEVNNNG